jgi:hypothetical protein
MGPKPLHIEFGDLPQRIVAATMRVAGQVVEGLEFAEDSHRDRCAQGQFELVESSDFLPQQQRAQHVRVKANGSHYVIVPTSNFLLLGTITKVGRIILVESILMVLFLLIRTAYTVRKHGETTDGL